MLLQLKNRKEELKTELKIIEADAHYIPFKDETFDAVISRNSIWPLSDPQRAIEEMVRVSRKKILIIEGDWYKNVKTTLRQKIFGKIFYKIYNFYYKIRTLKRLKISSGAHIIRRFRKRTRFNKESQAHANDYRV